MRQKGEQVDLLVGSEQKARMGLMILIQVRGEEGPEIGCHRLVLAAVSPYFRAMFRAQVTLFSLHHHSLHRHPLHRPHADDDEGSGWRGEGAGGGRGGTCHNCQCLLHRSVSPSLLHRSESYSLLKTQVRIIFIVVIITIVIIVTIVTIPSIVTIVKP